MIIYIHNTNRSDQGKVIVSISRQNQSKGQIPTQSIRTEQEDNSYKEQLLREEVLLEVNNDNPQADPQCGFCL